MTSQTLTTDEILKSLLKRALDITVDHTESVIDPAPKVTIAIPEDVPLPEIDFSCEDSVRDNHLRVRTQGVSVRCTPESIEGRQVAYAVDDPCWD